jgi:hypothetical protein
VLAFAQAATSFGRGIFDVTVLLRRAIGRFRSFAIC